MGKKYNKKKGKSLKKKHTTLERVPKNRNIDVTGTPIPEIIIPENRNIEVTGTPITQTNVEWLFGIQRYIHYFKYSIDKEEKSCEIITNTPVLRATISHISNTEPSTFLRECRNFTNHTDVYPNLVDNNREIIHVFDIKTPTNEGIIQSSSNFILQNSDSEGNIKKVFNAFIPQSLYIVQMW